MNLALLNYDAPYVFLIPAFVIAIGLELLAAILLKLNPLLTLGLAGLGLTFLSFFYQPLGPEVRLVGNVCDPISECLRPIRGGGFPIQYIIDRPLITFHDRLGYEDDFRGGAFIADLGFYVCLVSLIQRIIQYLKREKVRFRVSAG